VDPAQDVAAIGLSATRVLACDVSSANVDRIHTQVNEWFVARPFRQRRPSD
jgi:hypothetical protein